MNSGAPASIAPAESVSGGMITSHRARSVLYCSGEKNFGAYVPAGVVAFSAAIVLWAYSAASKGIVRSTEPAMAPMANDFRMSRRDMDLVAIPALQSSLLSLIEEIF